MQRPLFPALVVFVALVLGSAGGSPPEEVLPDCIEAGSSACQIEAALEDEVQELRTELLQTKLEVKKADAPGTGPETDTLHELRAETMAAETASREATKRMVDSMEAQARSDEALAYHPVAKKHKSPQEVSAAKHKPHGGGSNKLLGEAAIPAGALIAGGLLMIAQQTTAGLLAVYFGAQAGFSLYMKVVLSGTTISEELGLSGIPAGFLVTAIQQIVAFVAMIVVVGTLWWTPWRYTPRKLNNAKEVACVLLFSFAFALNIGLNNYSLSLLALSMNMIIRSCLPLVTLVLHQMLAPCIPGIAKEVGGFEVGLMTAGVLFAGLATLAKSEGSSHGSNESKHLVLGVFVCTLSDVAAALNLILAAMFGSYLQPKLNPMDTIFYMAVPCGLFLLPPTVLVLHPVDWPGFDQLTDFQVYDKVMELSPETMGWVLLSGFIALGYNVLQYTVVQRLSAEHAAFAGNFNKAALEGCLKASWQCRAVQGHGEEEETDC
eukprot:TRINITY_DN21649_c0_g1_i2.p1 TRINITY_DN21649_c0_g1~~TRINITY_DN21649_c0_g1_i2.p1  ORF type:complete len:491 (-),score=115.91 TRINITY_DN21649_c0_g1_i2:1309-2781(-)